MRERSRISVRHTTSESMLNPRPAKIPETRESTPGSFCTRQFSTCLAVVGKKGRGCPTSVSAHEHELHESHRAQIEQDALFERLEARRWGIVEDVRDSLFRGPRARQVHGRQRGRAVPEAPFVVERRGRVIYGRRWLGRILLFVSAERRGKVPGLEAPGGRRTEATPPYAGDDGGHGEEDCEGEGGDVWQKSEKCPRIVHSTLRLPFESCPQSRDRSQS